MAELRSQELADARVRLLSLEADIDIYRKLTTRLMDECRDLTRTVARLQRELAREPR